MIIVREVFIAKPGMASKLAKKFKEDWESWDKNVKIMTDLTGVYNKVVIESQYESMAAWEDMMKKYMNEPKDKKESSSQPYHIDMYTQGKREIFRIW